MATTRNYRREVTHALLWIFFGLLAAVIAPDLGIGIRDYAVIAALLAVLFGIVRMCTMPVHGLYLQLTVASGVMVALYAVAFALRVLLASSQPAVSLLAAALPGLGAFALLLLSLGLEIFCRRLKWVRLTRSWVFTEALVTLFYCLPAALGWFWDYYSSYLQSWKPVSALRYELLGFDFHGMRVPGLVGGPRWLILLALLLLAPAAAILVNLLRTYVHAASPPPPSDDSEAIDWPSR